MVQGSLWNLASQLLQRPHYSVNKTPQAHIELRKYIGTNVHYLLHREVICICAYFTIKHSGFVFHFLSGRKLNSNDGWKLLRDWHYFKSA